MVVPETAFGHLLQLLETLYDGALGARDALFLKHGRGGFSVNFDILVIEDDEEEHAIKLG